MNGTLSFEGQERGQDARATVEGTHMKGTLSIAGLPGAELIVRGVEDCAAGRESVESLLVRIGWPRLKAAGVRAGRVAIPILPALQ